MAGQESYGSGDRCPQLGVRHVHGCVSTRLLDDGFEQHVTGKGVPSGEIVYPLRFDNRINHFLVFPLQISFAQRPLRIAASGYTPACHQIGLKCARNWSERLTDLVSGGLPRPQYRDKHRIRSAQLPEHDVGRHLSEVGLRPETGG